MKHYVKHFILSLPEIQYKLKAETEVLHTNTHAHVLCLFSMSITNEQLLKPLSHYMSARESYHNQSPENFNENHNLLVWRCE